VAGSVNKGMIIGHLGKDPESRLMQSGGKVVSFSVATSESWKDKNSGERQERTQWHNVVIFNEQIGGIAEKYLKKGSKVFIEGSIETRKWTKDGIDRYTTEIVLRPFRGELTLLDSKRDDGGRGGYDTNRDASASQTAAKPAGRVDEMEDEIPF
jgi:single-strand DNA-binding protein